MKVERWAAGRLDGIEHAFDENGRSICGLLTSEDFSDGLYGRCERCVEFVGRRDEVEKKARKILGTSWPRALSVSNVAHAAYTSAAIARVAIERILEDGDAWAVETPSGWRRYVARRALVEEAGRTYGMSG